VSQLAWRWARLRQKPNERKRIALILANYPTKDGRIGNGVGLDTPASAIKVLNALQQNNYPICDIPADVDSLTELLQPAVTNNIDTLAIKGCNQSLAIEDYNHWFRQLPESNQTAVLEHWGKIEDDPKYRQGRLMISGIHLGETFVGIQPARGFNVDVVANYHDPDLVPPHNYLAFYFWLRHVYQADAFAHIGKHGNLEWLPGKSVALSDQCWPDVVFGPMPHLYPFIVNDPGEGSQANRQTQSVIIDHLVPPMAPSET
jgi:cobaltochelatase CobN